jgi:Tfp pilus assembly protein PilN
MKYALKQFNLLPDERKQRFARIRFNHKLVRLALAIFTLAIAGLAVLQAWEKTVAEQVQLAETRAAGLEANLAPFASLRTDAAFISERLATHDSLLASRIEWTALVLALAAATPADVQVIALTPAKKAGLLTFSLAGKATARTNLIRFKEALEATGLFHATLLESVQATTTETGEILDFSVTGQLGEQAPVTATAPVSSPAPSEEG